MTINTKKAFVPMMKFLEANKSKKVSTILAELHEMTKQKNTLKTFAVDEAGKVITVFCYYHKQYELLSDVAYGKKASSASGVNTMCKIGVSRWTKQNNAVKKVGETVLTMLENGDIQAEEIADTKEKLLSVARTIDDTDKPDGFETLEEALEANS